MPPGTEAAVILTGIFNGIDRPASVLIRLDRARVSTGNQSPLVTVFIM